MTRLLIQYVSNNPFGGELQEYGKYQTFDEAVDAALPLVNDDTIRAILANDGPAWIYIKP
jgi:hypothetical protein